MMASSLVTRLPAEVGHFPKDHYADSQIHHSLRIPDSQEIVEAALPSSRPFEFLIRDNRGQNSNRHSTRRTESPRIGHLP
jgi:hypothetical protein